MDTVNIGDGATIYVGSDRYAGTVIEVKKNEILIQYDTAIRTDRNGLSENQSYKFIQNPNEKKLRFIKGKKGFWYEIEEGKKTSSYAVIGKRDHYWDPSF